jgi:hypothetical protein
VSAVCNKIGRGGLSEITWDQSSSAAHRHVLYAQKRRKMSSNGASSPRLKSPTSPVGSMSQTLSETRLSLDSDRSSTPSPFVHSNGHTLVNGSKKSDDDEPSDPVEKLQRELERTREEKETLAAQYRNLLAKLTTMRTTLGNKLKQDAVRDNLA